MAYSWRKRDSFIMQTYILTTPQQNIYNETKFYTGTALGNIGGTIEFHMEGLTSEIIENAINLLIDTAEGLRLRITENDGEIKIAVCGNGFLYNMVRTLVGTLIDYADGKTQKETLEKALKTGERALLGKTIPAKGLCLKQVEYQ